MDARQEQTPPRQSIDHVVANAIIEDSAASVDGSNKSSQQQSTSSRQHTFTRSGNMSHRNSVVSPVHVSAWNLASDKQTDHKSTTSDLSDRVFPIRSVISVEANANRADGYFPSSDREDRVHLPSHSRPRPPPDFGRSNTRPMSPTYPLDARYDVGGTISPVPDRKPPPNRHHIPSGPFPLNIAASDKSTEASLGPDNAAPHSEMDPTQASNDIAISEAGHLTSRFTHIETEDGYSVITGRDGTLERCEDEPIHTPGAVQGFGALLALREESDGCFVVRYVSENSERLMGYSPRQLFKLDNFLDILTEEQQDNLLDHIDFIRDEDADPAINGPEVFSLSIRPPKQKAVKLWCAIHLSVAHPDLIICELELDDDQQYPLRPADEGPSDFPTDTLDADPTAEELEQSTEVLSKPLRILRSARKRRGEQGAMQVFDIMSQVQEQLASAANLENLLKILVGIVKELTGFHRVMIYQFDTNFNGKVVTELVDAGKTRDLYMGLHFPATDIPRQARELYKLNKVRLLYDRELDTARLVCRSKEDLDTPLDLSHSYLRAMSPIHLKYLGNMGVRSSMSVSISAFNELWGLIACHTYGPQGMRVSFPIRKMCRLVGDTASRNIERLSYASRLQARKLINTAPTDKNPSGYIVASSDDLLGLFDADFGLLSIQGETKILGVIDHSQEALAMLEYLRMRKLTSVVASQDVREDFPDLRYPPGFQVIAGLMYVPLSVGGNDFVVFFRRGQIKEVRWAGNPYDKILRDGTAGYLEPRTSFKSWHEKVIGKCRDWNEEQVETAAVLCLVYGKFIEVWRQKEAAIQSSKLTRILLSNSAHEVRTPLNAIINYLEIALEGSLDQETRDNLAKSHSASKSLIYVINDLLDLTKTEEGQDLIKDEVFDLSVCINEATEPFHLDAKRKDIDYSIMSHPGLPRYVHGDGRRMRQAISNVIANAMTHTSNGFVKVEAFVSEVREIPGTPRVAVVDFVFADSGRGMSAQQLDGLFRDLEQVSTEEGGPLAPPGPNSEEQPETRTLGLGLAVVARIIRNMDGQLRLKSEEGEGSRFVVSLPFSLPDDSRNDPPLDEGTGANAGDRFPNPVTSAPTSITAHPQGEIVLVDSGSAMNVSFMAEKPLEDQASNKGSVRSHMSQGSIGSQRSDADRLIDAIQSPWTASDKESKLSMSRKNSRGSLSRRGSGGVSTKAVGRVSPAHQRDAPKASPSDQTSGQGQSEIKDTKMPVKALKIPDEYSDLPTQPQVGKHSRVMFEIPSDRPAQASTESVVSSATENAAEGRLLQVLVAEDDPINMKILRKRLERLGHIVTHTVNGEDCAATYKGQSAKFDVVLMDMQMPIVDGLTSTKMIRACEKSPEHDGHSSSASSNGRIPIFAVSASLIEAQKQTYIDAGFDGWILKPIDFKRLNTLLDGIHDDDVRRSCLYAPGEWERGGWLSEPNYDEDGDTTKDLTPNAEDENKQMSARSIHVSTGEDAAVEAAADVQVVDYAAPPDNTQPEDLKENTV